MLVELPIAWVVGLNVIAWGAIQLGLAWTFTQLEAARFTGDNILARPKRWERNGRLYESVFLIKRWKDSLPDAASWFRGGFAKAHLRSTSHEFLERFRREAWRGELVHWLALSALPLFCLWNPWWAVGVNAAYAAGANLPCILVQRYNRARLQRVLTRKARDHAVSHSAALTPASAALARTASKCSKQKRDHDS